MTSLWGRQNHFAIFGRFFQIWPFISRPMVILLGCLLNSNGFSWPHCVRLRVEAVPLLDCQNVILCLPFKPPWLWVCVYVKEHVFFFVSCVFCHQRHRRENIFLCLWSQHNYLVSASISTLSSNVVKYTESSPQKGCKTALLCTNWQFLELQGSQRQDASMQRAASYGGIHQHLIKMVAVCLDVHWHTNTGTHTHAHSCLHLWTVCSIKANN